MNLDYSAFTLKSQGILRILKTDVLISSSPTFCSTLAKPKNWRAIWDTGATKSSIDKRVVEFLGLIPLGKGTISTANGVALVNTHCINVTLPNRIMIENIIVCEADLGQDVDMLIGMDIIALGDFSITNVSGATTFSFRIPSIKEIDYVEELNKKQHEL